VVGGIAWFLKLLSQSPTGNNTAWSCPGPAADRGEGDGASLVVFFLYGVLSAPSGTIAVFLFEKLTTLSCGLQEHPEILTLPEPKTA
jgi:hypothetical protein